MATSDQSLSPSPSAAPLGGESAHRAAPFVAELDDAMRRLREHAAMEHVGLTRPVPGEAERWEAAQVWAHLAEFGAYWRGELRRIVDTPAAGDDAVPFGRTKRDPHRVAMIDAHRHEPINRQIHTVRRDVAAYRADLAELTVADWSRRARHETLGEMDLWRFLDHFVTGHYVEHADQLDGLRSGRPDG